MNTAAAVGTYAAGFVIVLVIGMVIRRTLRGWRQRAEQQDELLGTLPALPERLGQAVIAPARGIYIGSTVVPNRLERITAGALGDRARGVLTRYPEGIMLERTGTTPVWMPQGSLVGVRAERVLARKVLPAGRQAAGTGTSGGLLVIRWRLPSGIEIDTAFRGEDRSAYARWIA